MNTFLSVAAIGAVSAQPSNDGTKLSITTLLQEFELTLL